jgi:fido (protein-threonine AMPylation protein)
VSSAGGRRTSARQPHRIADEAKRAFDDGRYWHDHGVFTPDERAVRLHYRLVSVRPFRNGNGRCTRLLADLYLVANGLSPLPWGGAPLGFDDDIRRRYIAALVAAPMDDCASLVAFACQSKPPGVTLAGTGA